jgi:hypothetical protein
VQPLTLCLAKLSHAAFPIRDKPERKKEDEAGSATIDDKTFGRKIDQAELP